MERVSYFIDNKAIFGGFPSQETVNELENEGTRFFINLTHNTEKKITPYITKYKYINYPIIDQQIPSNWKTFAVFLLYILDIINTLKEKELVYIHCKGGHGRSGIVVASILCLLFKMDPVLALEKTSNYHSKRSIMREKWRKMGSPQTMVQKKFVHKFFGKLNFDDLEENFYTLGFSNFSMYKVSIPHLGTFPSAENAIQALKNPLNKHFVLKQQNCLNSKKSKFISFSIKIRKDWDNIKQDIVYNVLKHKFDQNFFLKENLIKTGFRDIIYKSNNPYWGCGFNNNGDNNLGKVLVKLRLHYYKNLSKNMF